MLWDSIAPNSFCPAHLSSEWWENHPLGFWLAAGLTFSRCHWLVVSESLHPALSYCLGSSRGLVSGRREKTEEKTDTRGAEGRWKDPSKKERDREGSKREEQHPRAGRSREKGEGTERVSSSRAASAHGAGEKLWESKQPRRIPVCLQPLACPTGDHKDERAGPGSVVKSVYGRLLGLKVHQGVPEASRRTHCWGQGGERHRYLSWKPFFSSFALSSFPHRSLSMVSILQRQLLLSKGSISRTECCGGRLRPVCRAARGAAERMRGRFVRSRGCEWQIPVWPYRRVHTIMDD